VSGKAVKMGCDSKKKRTMRIGRIRGEREFALVAGGGRVQRWKKQTFGCMVFILMARWNGGSRRGTQGEKGGGPITKKRKMGSVDAVTNKNYIPGGGG